MEKQKGGHNNSVSNVHFNTFVRRVRSHSLLDHGRVDHVVEHPWQVDLFLWQVAVSMVEGLKRTKSEGVGKNSMMSTHETRSDSNNNSPRIVTYPSSSTWWTSSPAWWSTSTTGRTSTSSGGLYKVGMSRVRQWWEIDD